MTEPVAQRTVAIVGRPNVGKSALFNRIVGKRVSIVHETAGVTRDRVSREATWKDQRFELIDTGGLSYIDEKTATDEISAEMRKQGEIAVTDASLILFVTDVAAGVNPLDEEVATLLRKAGKPVLLVANKADNDSVERGATEFARFGFPVFSVAAIHNRGIDRLLDEVVKRLPPGDAAEQARNPLRVAVVGRPNAGKSSYLNRILRNDRLIVSSVAGTTRDSIEVPFRIGSGPQARHYVLIDTAGMRQARKVDNAIDRYSLMRADESIQQADVVLLAMDGEHGPTAQDKKIAAKILEHRKGCIILVNKWDLIDGPTEKDYETALRRFMPFLGFAPCLFVSAKSGMNIRKSIDLVDHVAAQISQKLPTATVNRILHRAVERVQPPMVKGKRLRLYYTTQVGERPIRLRMFVNDPTRITDAYRTFLINQLRDAFGLEGAPVILDFKSSHGEKKPER